MFIKGVPDAPKCKFTRRLMEVMSTKGYRFRTFDILSDERIRQWIKFYTNWPTIPQIFVNGKFVGGLDVILELIEEGEFDEILPKECHKQSAEEFFKT
jgi:Grx4 family monothiol glutaredoxin